MLGLHQNVLVTGGAGFIGSHLVHKLVKEYPETNFYNLDSLTYASDIGKLDPLLVFDNYHFIKADLCDRELINELFKELKFDGVFHLAAESHVDNSIANPHIFLETNVLGTAHLLESTKSLWMTRNIVSGKMELKDEYLAKGARFLHVSTDEVYGSLEHGSTSSFKETTPYNPNSPYSASKAASDHLVNSYYHTYDVPVVITNCSNNYGPWQHREKLIPKVINCLKEGKSVPVYGKGDNVRDWLYVGDHCNALITVFLRGGLGEKYNVGGRNEKSNLDLVYQLCDLVEKHLPSATNPCLTNGQKKEGYRSLITFVTDRLGHDARYAIDNTKISAHLDWQPLDDPAKALDLTVKSYLDNDHD